MKFDTEDKKNKDEKIVNQTILKKIWNLSLDHFFITFIILYIISTASLLSKRNTISLIFGIILILYIVIFLTNKIKININKFLHHELRLKELLSAYITSILFMILLFSLIFWLMTTVGAGYLRYGTCMDNEEITREIIANDPSAVTDIMHYPYFSATTFFSVGYGDICPMGMSKLVAIITAIVGNIFTVLIIAIAITNYSTNRTNEKKNKTVEKK